MLNSLSLSSSLSPRSINAFFLSTIFLSILNFVSSRDIFITEELTSDTFTTSDMTGWSYQNVYTCSINDFVAYSTTHSQMDIGSTGTVTSKTWTGLPVHWSISFRFDVLFQGAMTASDYIEIQIDSISQGTLSKTTAAITPADLYSFCQTGGSDLLVLYMKNVTSHTASSVTLSILSFIASSSSTKGALIQNLLINVDSCSFACVSCNGPAENQCLICDPSTAAMVSGKCECGVGYFAFEDICVNSCPVGYVFKYGTCVVDPCLSTCYQCDTVNKACTICISNHYHYNEYCVPSCSPLQIQQGWNCYDRVNLLTNGRLMMKALFSNTFGQSEIEGSGLVISNFYGFGLNNPSGALTTRCSQIQYLGGSFLSGALSKATRTFTGLDPHWSIRVNGMFQMIDSWDGGEGPQVKIDGVKLTSDSNYISYSLLPSCGDSHVWDKRVQVILNTTHSDPNLEVTFMTGLNESLTNESFGMRELYIIIDFCPDGCPACDASGCTACPAGKVLENNRCVCDSTCGSCSISSIICDFCVSPRFLNPDNTCKLTCPTQYMKDYTNQTCFLCDSSCVTCSSTASNTCLTCTSNYGFLNGSCYNTCPIGYYKVFASGRYECQLCDPTCSTCSGPASTECLTCPAGKTLLLSNNTCASSCQETASGSSLTCLPCDPSCLRCSGPSANECLSCQGLLYYIESTHTCSLTCPTNTFKNPMRNLCTFCDSSCATCSGKSKNACLTCVSPLLHQSRDLSCVESCQSNQYLAASTCSDCHAMCTTCTGALSTNCTSCSAPYFLDKSTNTCVSVCPTVGFFPNTTKRQCSQCNPTCATCDGPYSTNCLSCDVTMFWNPVRKQCKRTCPDGYYADTTNNQCSQCDATCLRCNGPNSNECLACDTTSALSIFQPLNNSCVSACNANQYMSWQEASVASLSMNVCSNCHSSCTTCSDGLACNICARPLLLDEVTQQCVGDCAENQYNDVVLRSCSDCDSSCETCYGSTANKCISCPIGTYLDIRFNSCGEVCASGYVANQSKRICEICHDTCSECTGVSANQCLSCQGELNFLENTCLEECPIGYYVHLNNNDRTRSCMLCSSTCKSSCYGPNEEDCDLLKVEYLICFYVFLFVGSMWVFAIVYGNFSDRQDLRNAQQFSSEEGIEEKSPFSPKDRLIQEGTSSKKQLNGFTAFKQRIQFASFSDLQVEELNQQQQQQLPSQEANINPTIETQGYDEKMFEKMKQQYRPRNSILNTLQIVSSDRIKSKPEFTSSSSSSAGSSRKDSPGTSSLNTGANKSRFSAKNLKLDSGSEEQVRGEDYLKHSILGNEWMMFVKYYNPRVSRAQRATIFFIKYMLFFFLSQHFYENQMWIVILPIFVGTLLNCIIEFSSNFIGKDKVASILYFSALIAISTFSVGEEILRLNQMDYTTDRGSALMFGIIFIVEFFLVQQLIGFVVYYSTLKYLNGSKNRVYAVLKHPLFIKQLTHNSSSPTHTITTNNNHNNIKNNNSPPSSLFV